MPLSLTPQAIPALESALDAGRLYIQPYGQLERYKARRNGQTKRWKRNPLHFYLPIKLGFSTYSFITDQGDLIACPIGRIIIASPQEAKASHESNPTESTS